MEPVMTEPWLGHRDACSLQWSDECDCPNGPEYLAEMADES